MANRSVKLITLGNAERTKQLRHRENDRECAGGASTHAPRSKTRPPQDLRLRALAIRSKGHAVSGGVLAIAAITPVKNAGCECGGGRGRISGERRTQVRLSPSVAHHHNALETL